MIAASSAAYRKPVISGWNSSLERMMKKFLALALVMGACGWIISQLGAAFIARFALSSSLVGALVTAVVTSLLKGKARVDSPKHAALTAARYLFACVAGCIVLDYLLGFIVQSAITGVAMPVVAIASMGFIVGDCIKAVVASLVASGLAKLQ